MRLDEDELHSVDQTECGIRVESNNSEKWEGFVGAGSGTVKRRKEILHKKKCVEILFRSVGMKSNLSPCGSVHAWQTEAGARDSAQPADRGLSCSAESLSDSDRAQSVPQDCKLLYAVGRINITEGTLS